jgi:hypothetical protein
MNLRDDDVVSAVALVMETNTSADVQDELEAGADGASDAQATTNGADAEASAESAPESGDESSANGSDGVGE